MRFFFHILHNYSCIPDDGGGEGGGGGVHFHTNQYNHASVPGDDWEVFVFSFVTYHIISPVLPEMIWRLMCSFSHTPNNHASAPGDEWELCSFSYIPNNHSCMSGDSLEVFVFICTHTK